MLSERRADPGLGMWDIPTEGIICRGRLTTLAWPEPSEYDSITALRNEPRVRRWFLDDRVLGVELNRSWLATGMKRPYEAVLSIRLTADGRFLGMIGWSDWDMERRKAWFGRLAADAHRIREMRGHAPAESLRVILDAAVALRDCAFERMGLDEAWTYRIVGNELAAKLHRAIGLAPVGTQTRRRWDGSFVKTVELRMTREQWTALREVGR